MHNFDTSSESSGIPVRVRPHESMEVKPPIKKLRAKNAHGKTRGKPTLIEHLGEGESSVWGISDGFFLGAMF